MRHLAALALLPIFLPPLAAPAVALDLNALANGEFDDVDQLSDWTENADFAVMVHSAQDLDLCLDSGSLDGDNTHASIDSAVAQFYATCSTAVVGGESYRLRGSFYFPNTSDPGRANLVMLFYDGSDCTSSLGIGSTPYANTTTTDIWQTVEQPNLVAPTGTSSVRVRIDLVKFTAGGSSEVLADRIFLGPTNLIDAHDFELGDACRWSSVVP